MAQPERTASDWMALFWLRLEPRRHPAPSSSVAGLPAAAAAAACPRKRDARSCAKQVKKGYVGIHSSGFKDFLLKPELLRAIQDCGFEHPSEGAWCQAGPGRAADGLAQLQLGCCTCDLAATCHSDSSQITRQQRRRQRQQLSF